MISRVVILFCVWLSIDASLAAAAAAESLENDLDLEQECENEFPSECGTTKVQPTLLSRFRIVGGNFAAPNSWPWQLSLQLNSYSGSTWKHNCGASILSNCYAVTAAHCVVDYENEPNSLRLVAGLHDRLKDPGSPHQVTRVIMHPDYKGRDTQWDNDIVLLKVYPPFKFSRNVSAVCLPVASPVNGDIGAATGWGYAQNGGRLNQTLNQVELPIITHENCVRFYPEVQSFDRRFCAGFPKTGGKDTCQGDSGGPYVTRPDSRAFYVAGVTSVGASCAEINKPGIYTNVFLFKDWILSFINTCKPNNVNNCEHSCENTKTSYRCTCHRGYSLQPDGKTCSPECGVQNDEKSKPPWLISLRNSSFPSTHLCSGLLVDKSSILTSARCVTKVSAVRQPKIFRLVFTNGNYHEAVYVAKINCNSTNGLCILKTSTNVTLNPVCLPLASSLIIQSCSITGWTHDNKSVKLHQCEQQPKYACSDMVNAEENPCYGEHSDSVTCTNEKGRRVLLGLVQSVCGDVGGSTQSVDVVRHGDWIQKIIANY